MRRPISLVKTDALDQRRRSIGEYSVSLAGDVQPRMITGVDDKHGQHSRAS